MDYKRFWPGNNTDLFWTGSDSDLFWGVATSMPTTLGHMKVRFSLEANTQLFVSPQSGATQTLQLPGQRWRASYELPPMSRAEAAGWVAWLTEQMGRAGRFYASDPSGKTRRGSGGTTGGTPPTTGIPNVTNVPTSNRTGRVLPTANWDTNANGVLLVGDYISFRTPTGWQEMHQVAVDANTDGNGDCVLELTTPIREIPDISAALDINNATCIMRLDADDGAAWDIESAMKFGISFNAVEVFS